MANRNIGDTVINVRELVVYDAWEYNGEMKYAYSFTESSKSIVVDSGSVKFLKSEDAEYWESVVKTQAGTPK